MSAVAGEKPVLWSIDARGVATVVLNRPHVNNAYDGAMIDGLHAAMDALGQHDKLRLVVLRGNGKHFQAGADLAWIRAVAAQSEDENVRVSRATAEAIRRLDAVPVPTLALVQGGCFGGGTGIVAACDLVIATEDAQFSITETRWGLMAGIIVPQLNAAIGVRQVRRYALTCERFGAAEARRIGLVHEVCTAADLDKTAEAFIDMLLMNAADANAQTKAVARAYAGLDVGDVAYDGLVRQHAAKRRSPEATEGLDSFRQKRKPSWYPG
ncbi:enoyl-CoA hydratase [Vineibacter terrae]|uniref:Enoyl-CoA hydratase n=1 Tax=Vineibacter terrae TaxID=2586908 RepID=A0A5C8PD64_9HYPH|nr:enoyl-CoA hydratase-related protein [Vineibacter terrae]TXL71683.1 enoyl-CoA hydratase [Vineibacter terrae]